MTEIEETLEQTIQIKDSRRLKHPRVGSKNLLGIPTSIYEGVLKSRASKSILSFIIARNTRS